MKSWAWKPIMSICIGCPPNSRCPVWCIPYKVSRAPSVSGAFRTSCRGGAGRGKASGDKDCSFRPWASTERSAKSLSAIRASRTQGTRSLNSESTISGRVWVSIRKNYRWRPSGNFFSNLRFNCAGASCQELIDDVGWRKIPTKGKIRHWWAIQNQWLFNYKSRLSFLVNFIDWEIK